MATNSWDRPNQVTIRKIHESAKTADGKLQYVMPPHSITELVFRR